MTVQPGAAVRIALASVTEGQGGLTLLPGATERIRDALAEDMAGENGAASLDGLIRLAVVLREKRNEPRLADAIGAIIRSVPEARAAVSGRVNGERSVDQVRGFKRREGREVVVRAPSGSESSPDGSIAASTLIDPTRRDRARAQSRARKEAKHGC